MVEGEQEGSALVAMNLLGKAVRNEFLAHFPDPGKLKKNKDNNPFQPVVDWFGDGNSVDILLLEKEGAYKKTLNGIPGLAGLVDRYIGKTGADEKFVYMEFILFALAEHSLIGKSSIERGVQFKDILGSMFSEKDLFGESN